MYTEKKNYYYFTLIFNGEISKLALRPPQNIGMFEIIMNLNKHIPLQ